MNNTQIRSRFINYETVVDMPRAPYSFTLRNTLYPEGLGLKAATPWWVMSSNQYESSPGAVTIGVSAASFVEELKAGLPLNVSDNCALMAVKSSQEAVIRIPRMLYTKATQWLIQTI